MKITQGTLLSVKASRMNFYVQCLGTQGKSWSPLENDILVVVDDPKQCGNYKYTFVVLHQKYGIGHAHFDSAASLTKLFTILE